MVSQLAGTRRKFLTICKINHVQPFGAGKIPKLRIPQVDCLGGMAAMWKVSISSAKGTTQCFCAYRWNMIHCAVVAMLSWLSLRAESLERTASSVYAMFAGGGVDERVRERERGWKSDGVESPDRGELGGDCEEGRWRYL